MVEGNYADEVMQAIIDRLTLSRMLLPDDASRYCLTGRDIVADLKHVQWGLQCVVFHAPPADVLDVAAYYDAQLRSLYGDEWFLHPGAIRFLAPRHVTRWWSAIGRNEPPKQAALWDEWTDGQGIPWLLTPAGWRLDVRL